MTELKKKKTVTKKPTVKKQAKATPVIKTDNESPKKQEKVAVVIENPIIGFNGLLREMQRASL